MKLDLRLIGAAAALIGTATAQAAYPGLTLSFVQPTGTATATETIDVYLRLTLDTGADAIAFDGNSPATSFGLNAGFLPTSGFHSDGSAGDFASYSSAGTNTAFGCSGTFTNVCDPGAYEFNFHTSDSDGHPSFNFLTAFNLAPGASTEYLFGSFTPVGGVAPAGVYTFEYSEANLYFSGADANGDPLFGDANLTATASTDSFTRTVTAVPEPASYALWLAGLVFVGFTLRRMRSAG